MRPEDSGKNSASAAPKTKIPMLKQKPSSSLLAYDGPPATKTNAPESTSTHFYNPHQEILPQSPPPGTPLKGRRRGKNQKQVMGGNPSRASTMVRVSSFFSSIFRRNNPPPPRRNLPKRNFFQRIFGVFGKKPRPTNYSDIQSDDGDDKATAQLTELDLSHYDSRNHMRDTPNFFPVVSMVEEEDPTPKLEEIDKEEDIPLPPNEEEEPPLPPEKTITAPPKVPSKLLKDEKAPKEPPKKKKKKKESNVDMIEFFELDDMRHSKQTFEFDMDENRRDVISFMGSGKNAVGKRPVMTSFIDQLEPLAAEAEEEAPPKGRSDVISFMGNGSNLLATHEVESSRTLMETTLPRNKSSSFNKSRNGSLFMSSPKKSKSKQKRLKTVDGEDLLVQSSNSRSRGRVKKLSSSNSGNLQDLKVSSKSRKGDGDDLARQESGSVLVVSSKSHPLTPVERKKNLSKGSVWDSSENNLETVLMSSSTLKRKKKASAARREQAMSRDDSNLDISVLAGARGRLKGSFDTALGNEEM